ncbi:MAG TPA: S-methyl-5'-thioadenosine phosphorylase [Acidobacteriota bacterium]|nr:S-methyl-5'-thioadenosine phosphorylase [Acidobacteriota bacterium]
MQAEIGIIGGSGLYDMEGLEEKGEAHVETPFGKPSDAYVLGELEGRKVAFLARHGRGHVITPSELNFRANIYGFKKLGVTKILSASAVGSLKKEHKPMDFLLPDQFIDRTRLRASTFFGQGVVAHISFADPLCQSLTDELVAASGTLGLPLHRGGTYVCMEGPAFSTRAESNLYRSWGASIIGMTNLQEAKLAREAEICYVTIAMVTDYDCWHEDHDAVTVEDIIRYLTSNSENAQKLIRAAVKRIDPTTDCACRHALKDAIITSPDAISGEAKKRLSLIIGDYIE